MNPQDANPQNFIVDRIIYTSPDGAFSIARGQWVEDEMNRFAMRWNGNIADSNDLGFPSSRGKPMWFQLPYYIRELLVTLIQSSGPMEI